jgi:tetratricopeptide (TPR) repeat protein
MIFFREDEDNSKSGTGGAQRYPWAVLVLLVAATLAVYWEVPRQDFVYWDDDINVYANPHLRQVSFQSILYFWQNAYEGLYSPLSYTVWSLLASMAQLSVPREAADGSLIYLNPAVFHTFNLGLHVVNVLLVFALLRLLIDRRALAKSPQLPAGGNLDTASTLRDLSAGAGAALFALHPLQVEAVAWITELRGLLCAFFSLLALWQYLQAAAPASATVPESDPAPEAEGQGVEGQEARTSKQARWSYVAATLLFGLALLSKPSAVVLPLAALILERWMLGRSLRQSLQALLPWFAMAAVATVVTKTAQQIDPEVPIVSLWLRPLIAGDALAFYLQKLLVPWQLGVDYGRRPDVVLQRPVWALGALLIACGLGVLMWRVRHRYPWLTAAVALFVAGVLPVLGLTAFNFQAYSTVADRYMYLSMLGPALGLSQVLARYHTKTLQIVTLLGLLLLGGVSLTQTRTWADTVPLLTHALDINPRSVVALNNMGIVMQWRKEPDKALSYYQALLKIKPDYAQAYSNMAPILMEKGNSREAIEMYRKAIKLEPKQPALHSNLGVALAQVGRFDEAEKQYRVALQLEPRMTQAIYNWGRDLEKRQRFAEAAQKFREALLIEPQSSSLRTSLMRATFNQGVILEKAGHFMAAIENYQIAYEMDPNSPLIQQALMRAWQKQNKQVSKPSTSVR